MAKWDMEARLSIKDLRTQVKGTADELEKLDRKTQQSFERLGGRARRAGQDLGGVRRGVDETGGAAAAMGTKLVKALSIGGLVAGAVSGIARLFSSIRKETAEIGRKGGETVATALKSRQQLLSLAGGDRAQARGLLNQATLARTATGMSAEEANGLVFQLESLGIGELLPQLLMAAGTGQGARDLAGGLGGVVRGFGISDRGQMRSIADKIFLAARSSSTDPTTMAEQMARLAPQMSQMGVSVDEMMGLFSTVALKDPRQATTWFKALGTSAMRQGHQGSLVDFVAQTHAMDMSQQELQKYLGSEEALMGYGHVSANIDRIRSATATIPRASRGAMGQALDTIRAVDPVGFQQMQIKMAEAATDVAREQSPEALYEGLYRQRELERDRAYAAGEIDWLAKTETAAMDVVRWTVGAELETPRQRLARKARELDQRYQLDQDPLAWQQWDQINDLLMNRSATDAQAVELLRQINAASTRMIDDGGPVE